MPLSYVRTRRGARTEIYAAIHVNPLPRASAARLSASDLDILNYALVLEYGSAALAGPSSPAAGFAEAAAGRGAERRPCRRAAPQAAANA
jgi:hypothetical protein